MQFVFINDDGGSCCGDCGLVASEETPANSEFSADRSATVDSLFALYANGRDELVLDPSYKALSVNPPVPIRPQTLLTSFLKRNTRRYRLRDPYREREILLHPHRHTHELIHRMSHFNG